MPVHLNLAINASIEAGKAILEIYNSLDPLHVITKDDDSPLTKADLASNTVINSFLDRTDFPVISEENKQLDYISRKEWDTCWMVDPLDGTKEFIKRNGEFTVNIALLEGGVPVLGVIYVPVSRELYYADVTQNKAFKSITNEDHSLNGELFLEKDSIVPSDSLGNKVRVVGSRSHMNQDTLNYIAVLENENKEVEIVSKGSSLKFCLVAEGKADVYPRFAPTMEWDTAAGDAICRAVGLNVISQETQQALTYNKENLLNPYFLVAP